MLESRIQRVAYWMGRIGLGIMVAQLALALIWLVSPQIVMWVMVDQQSAWLVVGWTGILCLVGWLLLRAGLLVGGVIRRARHGR